MLLKKAQEVTAADIDKSSLSKLWFLTPRKLRNKLGISVFDVTKKFPYPDGYFYGVFCTGVLHLFPKKILLTHIFPEFERVINKRGRIIFDFATDIKRQYPDGSLHLAYASEPRYKFEQALAFVKDYFQKYQMKIVESSVKDNLTQTPGLGYNFSCRFFLVDLKGD